MPAQRLIASLLLVVGLLLGGGCASVVTPKTAALRQVHDTYRSEFLAGAVPAASGSPAAPAGPPAAFVRSLEAIRDYRQKYPADSQELAHLKVLEGMIYLQSGRFGLASAVADDVEAAGGKLGSRTGRVIRDQLFARHFKTLVRGWSETRRTQGRQWQTFEAAASLLAADLDKIPADRLASPESDQGALYLATTGAIFYVWAFSEMAVVSPREAPAKKTEWFTRARDLIGRHLDASLKKPEVGQDLVGKAPEGLLRYVEWYHWLDRNK